MSTPLKIFGFGGTLRTGSLSKFLLDSTKLLCPENVEIEVFEDLGSIPMFNQDIEANMPASVHDFKAKIEGADALIISTAEYNYSVPGVIKNAIDWASRPYGSNSFEGKPVALMSEGGMLGGSRAQYHLRQILVFLNMHPLNKPEIIIPNANEKVKDGVLADEHTKQKLKEMVEALVAWTHQLKGNHE